METKESKSFLADDKQFRKLLKELLSNTDRIMRNAVHDGLGDDSHSLADESVQSLIDHAKQSLQLESDHGGRPQSAGLLHAYLSQCVRDQLSTVVRQETEAELQARPSGSRDTADSVPENQVVDTCVRHLLESPQYRTFVSDLQTAIARVTEHMTLDYFSLSAPPTAAGSDNGCCPVSDPTDTDDVMNRWSGNFSHGGSVSSLADGESVSSSSYGAFWEMLGNDRLQDLADRLGASDAPARLDALRALASLPIGEVVVFDNWPFMRAQLRRLLDTSMQQDSGIFECCLHIHAKMLRGGATSFCTAEGYANLAEALRHAVDHLPTQQNCVAPCRAEASDDSHTPSSELDAVLGLAKLVNTFQRVVPRYWVRFVDQHSRSIVDHTVRFLLDVPTPVTNTDVARQWRAATPLHFLALLDPFCVAFRGWTKGEYGRRLLISSLSKHPRVVAGLVDECRAYFDDDDAGETRNHRLAEDSNRPDSPHGIEWTHVRHCYVLHSVHFLGELLRSFEGRRLVDDCLAALHLTGRQFLMEVVWPATIQKASAAGETCGIYCLARTVGSVLSRMCTDEAGCGYCFGDPDGRSVGALLEPLRRWSSLPPDERCDMGGDGDDIHELFHAVEVLGALTDSCAGLRILLDHRAGDGSEDGLETVARFAEQLLLVPDDPTGRNRLLDDTRATLVTVGCRVLATHEGLQRLRYSELLRRVAEEWESQLRRGENTPVAGRPEKEEVATSGAASRDWLAEMATIGQTPLGVAALRDADLLQDVLNWAEHELADCKQTGGLTIAVRLMLSQVAAACCADPRLAEPLSPAVDLLADVIWSACDVRCLGGAPLDSLTPASQESLERHARCTLSDLLCFLPPCLAVTSALLTPSGAISGNEGEDEELDGGSGLVNLVVAAVDGSTPGDDLAAETGLQLLSALGAGLDTWLHLQGRHRLLEALLDAQRGNVSDGIDAPIVDNLSLRRNRLLVKMAEIGGEREKLLPPVADAEDIVDVDQIQLQWPFVASLPLPDQYLPALLPLSRAPREVDLFLRETREDNLDSDWLVYCCEVFRNCLLGAGGDEDNDDCPPTTAVQMRGQWYGNLLSFALAALAMDDDTPDSAGGESEHDSTAADLVGCQLVVSYGVRLGLLLVDEQTVDDLASVLQSIRQVENEKNFDWLAATVFLLMCGNRERTIEFRRRFDSLPADHRLVDWGLAGGDQSAASSPWLRFCHAVEIVLIGNLPLVFHALQRSGLSVGQICYPWLRQCFWNVLDWEEICGYLGLCLIMGRDYQIYFVVAIFRHLQKEVLKSTKDGSMALFFCETRLQGFRTKDYLPFMEHLESKYRNRFNLSDDDTKIPSVN